jgi:hypothetical protein
MAKTTCPDCQGGFLCLSLLGIFLLENQVEKTINCSNV